MKLIQALARLYMPVNDQERKSADKFLQDYQASPQLWQHSLQLLSSTVTSK
jgi:hypothetical protein